MNSATMNAEYMPNELESWRLSDLQKLKANRMNGAELSRTSPTSSRWVIGGSWLLSVAIIRWLAATTAVPVVGEHVYQWTGEQQQIALGVEEVGTVFRPQIEAANDDKDESGDLVAH